MSLRYKWFKLKQKFMKNFTTSDLKPGVKIETYKGISTIIEVSKSYTTVIHIGNEPFNLQTETSYVCDTNYYFEDEPDTFFEEDILRIIS